MVGSSKIRKFTGSNKSFTAEPPSYTLGEDSGKLALFKTGENTPVTRYEIYTGLLPEQDVAALQQGIPVATQKELRRYLEDFGA